MEKARNFVIIYNRTTAACAQAVVAGTSTEKVLLVAVVDLRGDMDVTQAAICSWSGVPVI